MRNKKKAGILILAAVLSILLTACGDLNGTYNQTSGYGKSTLTFDGNHLTINDLGVFEVPGTYTINGDKLIFDCFINGEATTYTYSWSKSGNTITFDGEIFIKDSNRTNVIHTIIIVILIVIGAMAFFTIRRAKMHRNVPGFAVPNRDFANDGEEWEKVNDDEWEEISPPTKQVNDFLPQFVSKENNSIIRIDADHCCICGRILDDGSTRLNGLQSGREAWIDSGCLKRLLIMNQSNNMTEFEEASRYMKSRVSAVDPDVGKALVRFIRKSEDRIYSRTLDQNS